MSGDIIRYDSHGWENTERKKKWSPSIENLTILFSLHKKPLLKNKQKRENVGAAAVFTKTQGLPSFVNLKLTT